jgi:phage repressor protein C with HTH and peptisase S24 domain
MPLSPIWTLGVVANMVTILFMPTKQLDTPAKWPNGLADAIAKAKEIDPEMGPTKLARLTKENKQTIARYIAGERKLPAPVAAKLAPLVRSTVADLLLVESDLPEFDRVPLLSWVSAGRLEPEESVENVDVEKHVIAVDLPKGDWIALKVRGDSMDRLAPDGSIIFVNRADQHLREDQFYVFSTGSGSATFKRFRGGKTVRLQPYSSNSDHETQIAPPDLRVIGRVRRVVTDLR